MTSIQFEIRDKSDLAFSRYSIKVISHAHIPLQEEGTNLSVWGTWTPPTEEGDYYSYNGV
jgi:hypothetical protein